MGTRALASTVLRRELPDLQELSRVIRRLPRGLVRLAPNHCPKTKATVSIADAAVVRLTQGQCSVSATDSNLQPMSRYRRLRAPHSHTGTSPRTPTQMHQRTPRPASLNAESAASIKLDMTTEGLSTPPPPWRGTISVETDVLAFFDRLVSAS